MKVPEQMALVHFSMFEMMHAFREAPLETMIESGMENAKFFETLQELLDRLAIFYDQNVNWPRAKADLGFLDRAGKLSFKKGAAPCKKN